MKMELFVADGDGKNIAADHQFRLRQFRADVHAGRQEDSVRIQQARLRRAQVRAVPVNTDGTDLEQVTDFGGFTAFPEFAPDGKTIVFASDKGAKSQYEFNIFTADWK